MSQDSKRIKVTTLVTLIFGLASIAGGVAQLVIGEPLVGSLLTLVSGVASAAVGVRGSLLANVPSNTPLVVRLSVVALLVQLALSAVIVLALGPERANEDPVALCFTLIGALLALVLLILSRRLKRTLDAR